MSPRDSVKSVPVARTDWGKFAIAALLIVTAALFLMLLQSQGTRFLPLALAAGTISLLVGMLLRFLAKKNEERWMKLLAHAAMNAWFTHMVLVFCMIELHDFGLLPGYSTGELLVILMFMPLAAFAAWFAYFNWRGDVA